MSLLTKPQGRIPIAYVMVQGQRVPVLLEIEWDRFLDLLTERAGGITGVSTTELVESSFEDAGINELQAQVFVNAQNFGQAPASVVHQDRYIDNTAELLARLDVLESRVKGLEQGD
jgi:hypothetical protein